jgi:hypothetical protein
MRLAVIGGGIALNVMDEWVMLSGIPDDLTDGKFKLGAVDPWKVGDVRFIPLSAAGEVIQEPSPATQPATAPQDCVAKNSD